MLYILFMQNWLGYVFTMERIAAYTIVYKKVDESIFDQLVTILEEENCDRYGMIRNEETVAICKFFDKSANEVTITHFSLSLGHTIMIQGKPKMFFAVCVAEVAGLIGREEKSNPTYLATPAERALEGHIRIALAGILKGHTITAFEPTERDENGLITKYELQRAHWKELGNNAHSKQAFSLYLYEKT